MKQQIKRAKKNLQDALKLIKEDDIKKDLLHDYVFDTLKAVENLNLDTVNQRSELLKGFVEYVENEFDTYAYTPDIKEHINNYIKTL